MMTEKHRIRSTSDADLAARHDKEPYTCVGRLYLRSATGEEWPEDYRIFAPRVECIPSRDPYPYVEVAPGIGNTGRRYVSREQASSINMTFRPRPAYARPEPNPILVAFRATLDHPFKWMRHPSNWLGALDDEVLPDGTEHCWHHRQIIESEATPAQIDDARKVLTRFVNVYNESVPGAPASGTTTARSGEPNRKERF